MKKLFLIVSTFIYSTCIFAQIAGNVAYQNRVQLYDNNINVGYTNTKDIQVKVKGLYNVKPDAYIAIFSVTQEGKTPEETSQKMNERIDAVKSYLQGKNDVSFYIDMVSFVPVYEMVREKKIFSQDTYKEMPKGFEMTKNIHIQFADQQFLEGLITMCAQQQIYDLVRVDCISNDLEKYKKEMLAKATSVLNEKIAFYKGIVAEDLTQYYRTVKDGFSVKYPVESYKSYQAFNSSSLNLRNQTTSTGKVVYEEKTNTLYYSPVINKEFDFVMNPVTLEPVIQIMFEITVIINRDDETPQNKTEYYFLTPDGQLKSFVKVE